MMLVVAVHGDNALSLRAIFQEVGKGGFQGRPLAPVHRVVEQMDLGVGVRRVLKAGQIFGLGPIVDQNNICKAVLQKPINHGIQLFIRVQGRKDYRNIG